MPVNENEQPNPQGVQIAAERANEQGLLFNDDVSTLPSDTGYRGPTACRAAGITYRQLDYWARTGLIEPTVRGAKGSGSQRLYSFRDILDPQGHQAPAGRRDLACSKSALPSSISTSAEPTT